MKAVQASSFLTITPVMELRPDLIAIIGLATGPTAQDKANAVLAQAKLRIRDGDEAYKSARYDEAPIRPAPLAGEQTVDIVRSWLERDDAEIAGLIEARVLQPTEDELFHTIRKHRDISNG